MLSGCKGRRKAAEKGGRKEDPQSNSRPATLRTDVCDISLEIGERKEIIMMNLIKIVYFLKADKKCGVVFCNEKVLGS